MFWFFLIYQSMPLVGDKTGEALSCMRLFGPSGSGLVVSLTELEKPLPDADPFPVSESSLLTGLGSSSEESKLFLTLNQNLCLLACFCLSCGGGGYLCPSPRKLLRSQAPQNPLSSRPNTPAPSAVLRVSPGLPLSCLPALRRSCPLTGEVTCDLGFRCKIWALGPISRDPVTLENSPRRCLVEVDTPPASVRGGWVPALRGAPAGEGV